LEPALDRERRRAQPGAADVDVLVAHPVERQRGLRGRETCHYAGHAAEQDEQARHRVQQRTAASSSQPHVIKSRAVACGYRGTGAISKMASSG
jgi:hypothetical protein